MTTSKFSDRVVIINGIVHIRPADFAEKRAAELERLFDQFAKAREAFWADKDPSERKRP